jgi:hypothetical protein
MRSSRKAVLACVSAVAAVAGASSIATAQVINSPTYKPVRTTGGWVYQAAWLLFVLAAVVVLLIVTGYVRRAPRFTRDEDGQREVRADRVRAGKDLPRRSVDVSQAAPLVVAPPAIPSGVTEPAAVAAPTAAPPASAPAPAPAPAAAPAPTPAAAAAPAPAPAPQTEAPAPAAADPAATPSATSAAPATEASAAPTERHEVSLDQETFDTTLAELLVKGTDRRVAEGQARRAAMIAARKKAGGG